ELCKAADELSAFGGANADLEEAVAAYPDNSALRKNVSGLSRILTAWRDDMQSTYGFEEKDLDTLSCMLEDKTLFADTDFFIDQFSSFTAGEYKVIFSLMKTRNVTVFLTFPKKADLYYCYEETADTYRRLIRKARETYTEVKEEFTLSQHNPNAFGVLKRELFRKDKRIVPAEEKMSRTVFLYSAEDPYEAADAISADIAKKIAEGARYQDFAIVYRQSETYAGILDASLEKYGIPFFLSQSKNLLRFSFVKAIESVYSVLKYRYRPDDVLTYLKNGFTDIAGNDADIFETYVLKWNIHGKPFSSPKPFTMNPSGYTKELSPEDTEKLAAVNRVKAQLLSPVITLEKEAKKAKTVSGQAEVLFAFLSAVGMEKAVIAQAKTAKKQGKIAEAEQLLRLPTVLYASLDTVCDVMGEEPADMAKFAEILHLLFSSATIGQIPTAKDQVTIGTADMFRPQDCKHVYLLGVNEGEFPAAVKNDSFFSQSEIDILKKNMVDLSPDLSIRTSREAFCFLRSLCCASETASLYTYKKTTGGKASLPSAPFTQIKEILGLNVISTSSFSASDWVYGKKTVSEHIRTLKNSLSLDHLRVLLGKEPVSGEIKDPDAKIGKDLSSLLFPDSFSLSSSRLDSYQNCPFSYYCQYVLKIDSGEEALFDKNEIGTTVHAFLELFFRNLAEKKTDIHTLDKAEIPGIAHSVCREYLENLFPEELKDSPLLVRQLSLLERNARVFFESLAEEFTVCKFTPVLFEYPIGELAKGLTPLSFRGEDGKTVSINGIVDRADIFSDDEGNIHLRVIDYKTGKKEFKKEDIARGRNMQMLMYLFALCREKNPAFLKELNVKENRLPIPAAMVYVKVSPKNQLLEKPVSPEEIRQAARKEIKRI
ncbi:MAG: PD-(D/E)XK nuclease family protein, partial [Clostridia bacterium]|nr:PD-(D/E)XK nuclease family protein [Clostridia bacterium]